MKLAAKLIICLYALMGFSCFANTYYIDAVNGRDENTGTAPSSALQTLARIQQLMQLGTITTGDTLKLACGQFWRESLKFGPPENNVQNIIVTADLLCASKPFISGADVVTGWQAVAGKAYYRKPNLAGPVMQVYVDGAPIRRARYPNTGYLTASANTPGPFADCTSPVDTYQPITYVGVCSLTDDSLLGITEFNAGNIIDAFISVRSVPYWWDKRRVVNYNPNGTIYWANRLRYGVETNEEYYLEGKLWMLDQPGEWYYDESSQELFVWLQDSTSPENHSIEVVRRNYAIHANTVSNLEISNIGIEKTGAHGVYSENTASFLADNLFMQFLGRDGFAVDNVFTRASITNNIVQNSGGDAIKVLGASAAAVVEITGNTIVNSGMLGASMGSPETSLAAIYTNEHEAVIAENTINNAGYIGIRLAAGSDVSRNTITNVCMVLSDCGGIYFWRGAAGVTDKATQIQDNIVMSTHADAASRPDAWGIYLDDFANGAVVKGNTLAHMSSGILVHLAYANEITNNVFYGNTEYQIYFSENLSANYAGSIHDNNVTGNQFFPLTQKASVRLAGEYNNINFAFFDENVYSSIISESLVHTSYRPSFPAAGASMVSVLHNFTSWQTAGLNIGMDANGYVFNSLRLKKYNILAVGENKIINSTLESGIHNWSNWSLDGQAARRWITPCVSSTGCLEFSSGATPNNIVSSNIFSLTKDQVYRVRFKLNSPSPVTLFVRRNGPSYESVGIEQPIEGKPNWENYEFVFVATQNLTNALFQFQTGAGITLKVDDAYLEVVTDFEYNENDSDATILLTNTSLQTKDLQCPFVDEPQKCAQMIEFPSAKKVQWPLSLAAMQSQVMIWRGSPFMTDLSASVDQDGDGLVDHLEQFIGTQVNNADSDADGLTDFEELNWDADPSSYNSAQDPNPLNPDTDGDSVQDGADASPLSNTSLRQVPFLPNWAMLILIIGLIGIGHAGRKKRLCICGVE